MSIIGVVQGLLGGKNRDKIVDGALGAVKGIGKFIDEQNLTAEEAAVFNKGAAEGSAQFVKDTLGESTQRSKTRRSIATWYIRWFCWIVVGIIVIRVVENWVPTLGGTAQFSKDLIIALHLAWAFIAVMTFFFGGYYLNAIKGQSKNKK